MSFGDSRKVAVGRHTIAVDILGEGPPAVFVHGFGADRYTWRLLVPELAKSFRCYVFDLPGIGESDAPDDFDYTLESLADVVAQFCEQMSLNDITLFCHSLGAAIGCLSLLRHETVRSKVRRLCILDGVCYPQRFPFFIALLRIPFVSAALMAIVPAWLQSYMVLRYCYFDGSKIAGEQVRHYAGLLETPRKRFALRAIAAGIDRRHLSSYSSRLGEIRVPTLLIWGDCDRVVSLRLGERLQSDLKATLFRVRECGHIPHEECAPFAVSRIREWIVSGR